MNVKSNFQTAANKQDYFTKKLKNYKKLLSEPQLLNFLDKVDDFDTSLILQEVLN